MAEETKRRGRPAGKRGTFSFRVTADLRTKLQEVATAAGRPVSEEIERRLERSFLTEDIARAVREQIRQEMRAEFEARREADLVFADLCKLRPFNETSGAS